MSDTFFWRPSSVTVSGRACIYYVFTHPIKDDDGAVVVELFPRHTTITLLVALASTCQSGSLDHLELKEQMQHSRHNKHMCAGRGIVRITFIDQCRHVMRTCVSLQLNSKHGKLILSNQSSAVANIRRQL